MVSIQMAFSLFFSFLFFLFFSHFGLVWILCRIYDDRWVRSILYSVEDIDSSLQFADDLLSDIQLPLIDGDDPEDEIALGSSDNLFDSDERSDPDEYDADVSMSSIRTLDYPPSPCTSLPDEDDFVSLKTSSVCC